MPDLNIGAPTAIPSTKNAWDIVSNMRTAIVETGDALQKDLRGFWEKNEEKEESSIPAWHLSI